VLCHSRDGEYHILTGDVFVTLPILYSKISTILTKGARNDFGTGKI